MAKMKRNYEVEETFKNMENSDNVRRRKSVFKRLMEAIKLLSEDDGEIEPVNENEVKIFNENLSSLAEVGKNNYKDSLQYNNLQRNTERTHSNPNRAIDEEDRDIQ